MPEGSSWRDAARYDYLQQLPPAEVAWEFLRRNAEYARDYARAARNKDAASNDALTARWGLRFRDKPEAFRNRGGDLLVPCNGSGDPGSCAAAGDPRPRPVRHAD